MRLIRSRQVLIGLTFYWTHICTNSSSLYRACMIHHGNSLLLDTSS